MATAVRMSVRNKEQATNLAQVTTAFGFNTAQYGHGTLHFTSEFVHLIMSHATRLCSGVDPGFSEDGFHI